MGPRRLFITNSSVRKEGLKYIFNNGLCAKSIVAVTLSEKHLASFSAVQGGNLQKPQNHELLLPFEFFSQMIDTVRCPFQPNALEELPPRPLRLASFITEHCEPIILRLLFSITEVAPVHCEPNLSDGFIGLHGQGQGLAAEWVDGSSSRTQSKWHKSKCYEIPTLHMMYSWFDRKSPLEHTEAVQEAWIKYRFLFRSIDWIPLSCMMCWNKGSCEMFKNAQNVLKASARACTVGTSHKPMLRWLMSRL